MEKRNSGNATQVFRVTYSQACEHFKRRIPSQIQNRIKGGALLGRLKRSIRSFASSPDIRGFGRILFTLSIYCFGGRTVKLLVGKKRFGGEQSRIIGRYIPSEGEWMYHWTSEDNLDSILREGLTSGRTLQFVYLTDAPEYLADRGFFYWKAYTEKKEISFVLLRIDAGMLAKKNEIYRIDAEHEFAVRYVAPELLTYDGL